MQSQLSLFGGGAPRVATDEIGSIAPRRIVLGGGAWLDHAPGFLLGHEVLFEELITRVQWKAQRREMFDKVVAVPRLFGHCAAPPPLVEVVGAALSQRYGRIFDSLTYALYRNGHDSVTWHGDRGAREASNAHVVTLSLGTPRAFLVRPKDGVLGQRHRFELGSGDLMVMGGACQRNWEHAVTKVSGARADRIGPRLVVMYRATSEWEDLDIKLDANAMPERTVRTISGATLSRGALAAGSR